MNYYNEFDPKMAAWLRELIKAGEIPNGHVDERSIKDVNPDDLSGFTQCHFFAGIGGWPYALRLAGWEEDREIWTGSCPCQPFSTSGKGLGIEDPRHLWPEFYRLIKARKPTVTVGEQVASPAGRKWLAGVQTNMEALGHQFAAADLCSASVGAPNVRARLYWVGDAGRARDECELQYRKTFSSTQEIGKETPQRERGRINFGSHVPVSGIRKKGYWTYFDALQCLDRKTRRIEPGSFPLAHGIPDRLDLIRGYGNAINAELAKVFIESVMDIIPSSSPPPPPYKTETPAPASSP